MGFIDLSGEPETARSVLRRAGDPDVRPVLDVIDGRRTHEDVGPEDWLRALELADGAIAVYFSLAADHEWWLAYDADPEPGRYDDEHGLAGPYHRWSTYPSGPWDHSALARAVLKMNLDDIYWLHDAGKEESDIYRSKVVLLEDAREFVQRKVRGESR